MDAFPVLASPTLDRARLEPVLPALELSLGLPLELPLPVDAGRLLREHTTKLRAQCRRLCGPEDDAEELLQDTCVEVIRHIHGFRGDASFLTWATAVARSQLHRQRRRRRRYAVRDGAIEQVVSSFPEFIGRREPCPEHHAGSERLREALAEALSELSTCDRQVFLLRQIEGMTAPEVGAQLGLSVAAVKSRLHRARSLLRARLGADVRVQFV